MKATTTLPAGYAQRAIFDPLASRKLWATAVLTGVILLVGSGWLLAAFLNAVRPASLAGIQLNAIVTETAEGATFTLPFGLILNFIVANILVLILHELAHGLAFWFFSGARPRFGVQGLAPYAAAPLGVFFPRNQVLIVGLAPLLLLTLICVPLVLLAPIQLVPIIFFFTPLNIGGSAMDLLMVAALLSFPANTLMKADDLRSIIYGPKEMINHD